MDPRVFYDVMMSRYPAFIASVIQEVLHHQPHYDQKVYSLALVEASKRFLASMCVDSLVGNSIDVHLTAENDAIVVNGISFSRRHFAHNYNKQFIEPVSQHYSKILGRDVVVTPTFSDDGTGMTLHIPS